MSLLLPKVRAPVLKRPSYEVLNMAFGVGAGAVLFDKSRYRSHGAITTATWAAGLHGYCLDFVPGNPDWVDIPAAHTLLDFTTGDFSIIARVYCHDPTADRMILHRGQPNVNGYGFYIHNSQRIRLRTSQLAASQLSASAALSIVANTWYTLGCSRVGASVRVFINGVDSTAVAGVHIAPVTAATIECVGNDVSHIWAPFDGLIEFVRVLRGVALVASEHLAWHRALA